MAVGFRPVTAASLLDALCNATAFTGPANLYVKLHVGDPGVAGTANAATETTRHEVTFGSASGGSVANDGAVTWTNISGSQDATHFSVWDNVSAGTFLFSGLITANAYTAGDTYTFDIGSFVLTLNAAA